MLSTLLSQVFSESAMVVWIPWVASALLTLAGYIFKGKLDAKADLFHAGLQAAALAMAAIAPHTQTTADDKIAFGLKVLAGHFEASGQTLAPVDAEKAKALFAAMHGAT